MSRFGLRFFRWSSRCSLLLFGVSMLGLYATPGACAEERGAVCVECHEQAAPSFNSSFHARIWQGENDCDACHGGTDKHVNDPSKETIVSFGKGGKRPAAELSEQCLGCHAGSAKLTRWDRGEHQKNDVPCTACHAIHQPRSAVKQPEVCFGCHRDVRSDANKLSHHPMVEGKVKCSDCHMVHGSQTPHLLAAESNNQLCYKCHADKRGPFVWQHPPVEEDCLICHTPHGSRHETLLVEKVVTLCLNCHDEAGLHNATAPLESQLNTDKRRFVGRACLECHHAIHGSANFRRSPFTR